jgi:uncharacterized membrane protein YhaH (DUF805 family)
MTMDTPPPPPPPGSGGGATHPMSNPLIGYWKRVVLERYAQFTGRSSRAEFWWYFLANIIISIVLNVLVAASSIFWVPYVIYSLAVLIPGLAVGVRRLHDTNRSGWWLLIALIPIAGIIVLIVFWASDATPGPNQYGVPEAI